MIGNSESGSFYSFHTARSSFEQTIDSSFASSITASLHTARSFFEQTLESSSASSITAPFHIARSSFDQSFDPSFASSMSASIDDSLNSIWPTAFWHYIRNRSTRGNGERESIDSTAATRAPSQSSYDNDDDSHSRSRFQTLKLIKAVIVIVLFVSDWRRRSRRERRTQSDIPAQAGKSRRNSISSSRKKDLKPDRSTDSPSTSSNLNQDQPVSPFRRFARRVFKYRIAPQKNDESPSPSPSPPPPNPSQRPPKLATIRQKFKRVHEKLCGGRRRG